MARKKKRIGDREALDIAKEVFELLGERKLDHFETFLISLLLLAITCRATEMPRAGCIEALDATFVMVDKMMERTDWRPEGHA